MAIIKNNSITFKDFNHDIMDKIFSNEAAVKITSVEMAFHGMILSDFELYSFNVKRGRIEIPKTITTNMGQRKEIAAIYYVDQKKYEKMRKTAIRSSKRYTGSEENANMLLNRFFTIKDYEAHTEEWNEVCEMLKWYHTHASRGDILEQPYYEEMCEIIRKW